MNRKPSLPHWLQLSMALVLMLIPACMFFAILWRTAVNLPILDDYQIVFGALHWASHHHGFASQLGYLLTAEHNGYKLAFENAVVFLQYAILGRLEILPLVFFGDVLALFIFITVLCMSRLQIEPRAEKWLLLAPVAWLVLQLQYASALNFASSSLQHLAVLLFSLLSVLLLARNTAWTFPVSCVTLVLAVCSSPNGFFVLPIGVLMLWQRRRWGKIAVWIALGGLLLAAYLLHYRPELAGTPAAHAGAAVGHPNVLYALVFLGASAARFVSVAPGLCLGVFLLLVFILATWKRYYRQNPAVHYSMLFILINAVAVSALRSDQGLAQSLASRYRLYSNLFLAFSYMFAIEKLFPSRSKLSAPNTLRDSRLRYGFAAAVFVFAVLFCILSDRAGAHFLEGKKQALTYSYRTQWQGEHLDPSQALAGAAANTALLRQIRDRVYAINVPVLRDAIHDGFYRPPQTP